MPSKLPDPWLSFLREVDHALNESVEVHCLGAFVLTVLWGLPRATGDIDVVEVVPTGATSTLLEIGGEGSALSHKYKLYIQKVGIAEYPDDYASRLIDITPHEFRRLRLMAFDPNDLALAKLARNSPRDREDVAFLVQKGVLQRKILQERFDTELRPNLLQPERAALTLDLWLEELFPAEQGR